MPSANNSTVTMTRAVRESARSNKFSRGDLDSAAGSIRLVPDYFGVIGRNGHLNQFEVVLIVHPQSPLVTLSRETEAQQLALGSTDLNFLFPHQADAQAHRGLVLRNKHTEGSGFLLAFQTSGLILTVGCEIAPDENLAMHEEIVVQDRGSGWQQERLFSRLGGSRCSNLFREEIIAGGHGEGSAGGLAPFIAKQISAGSNFQVRFLTDGVGPSSFLQLRVNGADAIGLFDAEGLSGYALAFDEDAERARIDGPRGFGLRLVLLVAGISGGEGGQGRSEHDRDDPMDYSVKPHSTSPCSVRIAIVFRSSPVTISAAMSSMLRPAVPIFSDALE